MTQANNSFINVLQQIVSKRQAELLETCKKFLFLVSFNLNSHPPQQRRL